MRPIAFPLFALLLTLSGCSTVGLDDFDEPEVELLALRPITGVSNQPLRIEPFSEATAELEVAAGMLSSLALLRDLMTSPAGESIPYRLNAKLSRGGIGGTLRVSREGSIDLGRRP